MRHQYEVGRLRASLGDEDEELRGDGSRPGSSAGERRLLRSDRRADVAGHDRLAGDISLYELLKMHDVPDAAVRADLIRKTAERIS